MKPGRIVMLPALLAAVPLVTAATGDAPADYAVRLPITPAAGGSLQRLDVPAAALAASREAGLADLRIFDAGGKAVPFALSPLAAARVLHDARLEALPILGAPDALAAGDVTLTIDAGRTGVVRVRGVPADAAGIRTIGALFDTRHLIDPADRLRLDATIPRGRPIAFTIEASADLKTWEPLGETTLYSAAGGATAGAIDLPAVALARRYLRVTWSPSDAAVAVRGASVTMTRAADPGSRPRAVIRPATVEAKAITFAMPSTAPVATLEVVATGADAVIPVRILGRTDREQPWTPIATGSVFRVTENGVVRRNAPFDLGGTAWRTLRIEADARSAGFTAPPEIAVRFAPARLLFLASGTPPFTLAAGLAGAAPAYLPAGSLVPGYGPAGEARLPVATIPAMADPVIAASADDVTSRKALLLWAVLLAATALLGAMVYRLSRQRPPAA